MNRTVQTVSFKSAMPALALGAVLMLLGPAAAFAQRGSGLAASLGMGSSGFILLGLGGKMGSLRISVHGDSRGAPAGKAARLQGSRPGAGDYASGRAKRLWDKGMGD